MKRSSLAIDPGAERSGWCVIDLDTMRPDVFGIDNNDDVLDVIFEEPGHMAIEMVSSYGMPVGQDVFETCVWIGRFIQHHRYYWPSATWRLVYRADVKLHHCHSRKASDVNVKQALIDRFASGIRNHGKGTKAEPGWFHGFHTDVWQAYALAIVEADRFQVDRLHEWIEAKV